MIPPRSNKVRLYEPCRVFTSLQLRSTFDNNYLGECAEYSGEGANEAELEEILKADKSGSYKAVLVVHNETTTGVASDIPGVRKAIDNAGHE